MKGKTVFERMTDVSDRFLEEAAFAPEAGTVLTPPRRQRGGNWFARFASSGWGVACICFVVAVAAVIGMAAWGRMGSYTPPVIGTNASEIETTTEYCSPDHKPLTEEVEREIIQRYVQEQDMYGEYDCIIAEEDVSLRYYGCYGGGKAYVMFVDVEGWEPITAVIGWDIVNGLKFVYPTTQKLLVYRDGFWSLAEAFEKEYLSANDLDELYRLYTNAQSENQSN